jgi:hypothetical protein
MTFFLSLSKIKIRRTYSKSEFFCKNKGTILVKDKRSQFNIHYYIFHAKLKPKTSFYTFLPSECILLSLNFTTKFVKDRSRKKITDLTKV